MGAEFPRAEFWTENDNYQISDEWLNIINSAPKLSRSPKSGEFHAIWNIEGADREDWLAWFQGNISTKWPPTAFTAKCSKYLRS